MIQFTLKAILNNSYTSGTLYINNADFTCTLPSVCSVLDDGIATGTILGLSNLVLTKSLLTGGYVAVSGDIISYSISLINSGSSSWLGDWCITDSLPSQFTLLSSSLPQLTSGTG